MKAKLKDGTVIELRKQLPTGQHDRRLSKLEVLLQSAVAESERYFRVARDDRERRSALLNLTMTYVDQGATDRALGALERVIELW